jgi:hypothetical protein
MIIIKINDACCRDVIGIGDSTCPSSVAQWKVYTGKLAPNDWVVDLTMKVADIPGILKKELKQLQHNKL